MGPRRHRRVVAPATNPGAEESAQAPVDDLIGVEDDLHGTDDAGTSRDPREAWMLEQRPPHWGGRSTARP